MKQCPSCHKTFDDSISFCLDDGSPLVSYGQQGPASFGVPVAVPQPGWQPPPPPQFAPQAVKSSRAPLVLGCLGLAFLVIVGIGIVAGIAIYSAANKNKREMTVGVPPPPRPLAPNTVLFRNSPASLGPSLTAHYTDFSFAYPKTWTIDPASQTITSANFIKVEHNLVENAKEYTIENFAVGWYTSSGTFEADKAVFPQVAKILSDQFAPNFSGYEKISEGETRIGNYDGYEFKFKSLSRHTAKGDVTLWGRAVMLPSGSPTRHTGPVLIMLASSLSPTVHSVDDVGVKGDLPIILNSFRVGPE